MKIRMIPENKVYAGTPTDIVRKLSADAIFLKHKNPENYLQAVSSRLPSIKIEGKTLEEQCEALLCGMLANGMAKIVPEEPFVDQYEIRLIRRVLGISQERLAHRLGVSFATVNRWEKGLHTPRSGPVIMNLRRVTGRLNVTRIYPSADELGAKIGLTQEDTRRVRHVRKRRKPSAAFMKPVQPDADLGAVVGTKAIPRTEVTKKLWAYIKRNGLQDKKKKTTINADNKLKAVFGGRKTVTMFEMTKLVNKKIK